KFNSWVGKLRYQLVLNLVDGIREMLMARFDEKRRIVRKWKGTLVPAAKNYLKNITKNLGEYAVCRSSDNRAEVKHKGKRSPSTSWNYIDAEAYSRKKRIELRSSTKLDVKYAFLKLEGTPMVKVVWAPFVPRLFRDSGSDAEY
ncbi:hypothetical protein Tco_0846068, partial [Tanacetum coccineum]